jgi:curved DNA-binding protein CbpA/tetratricopeptide (TPR) repeat protein
MGLYYHVSADRGNAWILANVYTEPRNSNGVVREGHPAAPPGHNAEAENEWVFIGPKATDRFVHAGDVVVPGFGKDWKHVDRPSRFEYGSDGAEDGGDHEKSSQDTPSERALRKTSQALTQEHPDQGDDPKELPQLLAPIACDPGNPNHSYMFEQLLVQYRRQKRAEAEARKARRNFETDGSSTANDNQNESAEGAPSATVGAIEQEQDKIVPTMCESGDGPVSAEQILQRGDFGEAARCYADAALESQKSFGGRWAAAQLHLRSAASFRRARDFDAAQAAAEISLGIQPDCAAAYQELGMIHIENGRPKDALSAFEKLYSLNELDSDVVVGLLVMATAAEKRAALFEVPRQPSHLVSPGCEVVAVGKHLAMWPHNKKTACCVEADNAVCPTVVNSTNWVVDEVNLQGLHMSFNIEQNGKSITVSRRAEEGVEITHGWDLDLNIKCCVPPSHSLPTPADPAKEVDLAATPHTFRDYYAVLEISRDFEGDELKHKFRRLSLKIHPDKPGGSIEAFERVTMAHECLSDEICRRDYDTGADLGQDGRENSEETLFESVHNRYFPEKNPFQPFGDPKAFAQNRAKKGDRGGGTRRPAARGDHPRRLEHEAAREEGLREQRGGDLDDLEARDSRRRLESEHVKNIRRKRDQRKVVLDEQNARRKLERDTERERRRREQQMEASKDHSRRNRPVPTTAEDPKVPEEGMSAVEAQAQERMQAELEKERLFREEAEERVAKLEALVANMLERQGQEAENAGDNARNTDESASAVKKTSKSKRSHVARKETSVAETTGAEKHEIALAEKAAMADAVKKAAAGYAASGYTVSVEGDAHPSGRIGGPKGGSKQHPQQHEQIQEGAGKGRLFHQKLPRPNDTPKR